MIGFVGLGNMGIHMARNILRRGKKLIVYDLLPGPMEKLKVDGAETAKNLAELVSVSSHIITIIPTPKDVYEIYTKPDGILEHAKPNTLCIESSTIDPDTVKRIHELAKAKNIQFIDAPVAGAVKGAEAGTLTFMVGGDQADFKEAEPTMKLMGKNIVYCGPPGSGQVAKICNNMLLAITMLATSEALNLGQRMGLDINMLTSIINSGSGRSWTSETYNPVPGVMANTPSTNNYTPGFTAKLMTKDLGLAQGIALQSRTLTPLGSLTHSLYRLMIQSPEYQQKDFSVIYKFITEQMKTD